jgi:lipopolysaccharide export system ATP-binding protein
MFASARSDGASTILKVEGLIKIYGSRRVVDGVSFHVNKGEIVGLLGPNGSGKTTSFRMACGLINTNGGIVYLANQNVTDWPMYRRSRDGGMGYLPQDRSVFQKLSVQNNLYGVMEMLGMKKAERKHRCEELLEKFHLTHLRQSFGGSLSGGERRRLEIARSLVSNPKIILLDEPFAAIDPVTVASIQEIIRKLAAEGIAILVTDHSVQDTLEITRRSYVIQAGKVLCHGTPEEVLANPEAKKVYFGDKQDRFRSEQHAEQPHGHKKHSHSHHHHSHRKVDPDWEVPPTEIIVKEKEHKHEPMGEKSRPFHLQFHTPSPMDAQPEVLTVPAKHTKESSDKRAGKRLRPISSSITPDVPSVADDTPQEEQSMSGIIRNLGQMIWKK